MVKFTRTALVTIIALSVTIKVQGAAPSFDPYVLAVFPDRDKKDATVDLTYLGFELAWKSIKIHGPLPRLVRLRTSDVLQEAATEISTQIQKSRPIAMLGSVTSNHAMAVGELAEEQRIPFVTPFATSEKVTEGRMYVFRTCFDDNYQIEKLANYILANQKLRSGVIIFDPNQIYSLATSELFAKLFKQKRGRDIPSFAIREEKEVDDPFLDKTRGANPDFVFMPLYQMEAAAVLVRLNKSLPRKTLYFGPDSWGGGRLFHNMFQDPTTPFSGYYVQHWSNEFKSDANEKFLKLLKSSLVPENLRFSDNSMNAPIAMGYDAAAAILKSYDAAAISNSSPDSASKIVSSLNHLSFEGVSGPISFLHGHTPRKPLFIYSITSKREVLEQALK